MLLALANGLVVSPWRRHLLFASVTVFTIAFAGYHFGTFDQTIHIPFLKKYVDPSLFPGDPFLDLRLQHFSYFWLFFQPVLRAGILEPVLFAVHVMATYATFWTLWNLSMTLFRSPVAALLSTLAFAFPHIGFAGFPIIEFSLLNRTFALPFLIVAITLYLRQRRVAAFMLLGVMYNVHVISTQFVLAMLLFDSLLQWRRIGVKRLAAFVAVIVLGALPVLAWKFGSSPVDLTLRPEWHSLIARGTLYNLFFLMPPFLHIQLITLSGISALAMFFLSRGRSPAPQHDRSMTNFVIAGLIILAVQFVTAKWLPVTIIIQSQIIRIGVFLLIFGYLYFARYLADVYLAPGRDRSAFTALSLAYISLTMPITLLLVWLQLRVVRPFSARRKMLWGSTLLFFCMSIAVAVSYNIWDPRINVYGPRTDWVQAQLWARDNTPLDALFITPPHIWWLYESDWRVFSERSTVATLSELLEAAFAPEYLDVWQPRIEALAPGAIDQFRGDIFENRSLTAEAYYMHSTADFVRLGAQFGAQYLVVDASYVHDLPVAYENDGYRVYVLAAGP